MLEILEFIFENPWHYFGFIFLWCCTIGAIRITWTPNQKGDDKE